MPKLAPIKSASDRASQDVLQLIRDYQRASRAALNALKIQTNQEGKSGAMDFLKLWRTGKLARRGRLSNPPGRFTFHGAGCRFEISGRTIEVEFGPAGRHDGFDAWRLSQYAKSAFEWFDMETDQIQKALKKLESDGLILHPGSEPGPHLYYFSDDIRVAKRFSKRRAS